MLAAERLAPKMNEMLDKFEAGQQDSEHIQSIGFRLRNLILGAGLADMQNIPPQFCAVSPSNREGEMLIPVAVWELLSIVATVKGWDPTQLKGAFAHELPRPVRAGPRRWPQTNACTRRLRTCWCHWTQPWSVCSPVPART